MGGGRRVDIPPPELEELGPAELDLLARAEAIARELDDAGFPGAANPTLRKLATCSSLGRVSKRVRKCETQATHKLTVYVEYNRPHPPGTYPKVRTLCNACAERWELRRELERVARGYVSMLEGGEPVPPELRQAAGALSDA